MSVKDQLREVYRLDRLIECKKVEIDELRALAVYNVPLPDPNGGGRGTSDPHSHENLMVKIVDLERYIDSLLERWAKAYVRAGKYIESLQDERMKRMFSLRYLHYRPWKEIASALDMTERGVFKMHGRGLQEIEKNFLNGAN